MGDPIINAEIKNYLAKEIGEKSRELHKNTQDLTETIEKQQKTIEILQKKVQRHKEIINKCLCDKCESKLTCELTLW